MHLHNKILILLGLIWGLFLGVIYINGQDYLMKGYLKLENIEINKNLYRVNQSLDQISYALGTFTTDWGYWNDAYNYLEGKNPGFIPANIDLNALSNSAINLLLYLNLKGEIIYGLSADIINKKFIPYPQGLENYIFPGSILEKSAKPLSNFRGFISLPSGIMLVAATGVSHTDSDKPMNGILITGRNFSKALLDKVSQATSLNLFLYLPKDINGNPPLKKVYDTIMRHNEGNYISLDNDKIAHGYTLIRDINDKPIGLIQVAIPRDIYITGIQTIRYYLGLFLLIGLLLSVVVWFLLRVLVLDRLKYLNDQIREFADKQDYTHRLKSKGNDELASLAIQFNQMMKKIEITHDQLEDQILKLTDSESRLATLNRKLINEINERKQLQNKAISLHDKLILSARRAGMADIVSGVLHNVGNILTSVMTSVSMIRERIDASRAQKLSELITLLDTNKDQLAKYLVDDSKGKLIPEYLKMLSKKWLDDNHYLFKETESLDKNINDIKNVIAMQQTLSRVIGMTEEIYLIDLVEDALSLNKPIYENSSLEIIRDFEFKEKVIIDRVKLLHVIVNLIKNSVESIFGSKKEEKKITISIKPSENNTFVIAIRDNGIGIAAEHLKKIFMFGFTTKNDGHGFGMHTSATFIQEMGGSLSATSDGINKGATMTITLPIKPKDESYESKKELETHF